MNKKIAFIFLGLSMLVASPVISFASASKSFLPGRWECYSSFLFDGGVATDRYISEVDPDGTAFTSGTLTVYFDATPSRKYQFSGNFDWFISGNFLNTKLTNFQSMEIGPNHDEDSIDLNKQVQVGQLNSNEILKLTSKESVSLSEGLLHYCSKLKN
tara:strand:+ start:1244 stop:1714 length:471 start_codon:yes stop_codon:yes gene_type:complete